MSEPLALMPQLVPLATANAGEIEPTPDAPAPGAVVKFFSRGTTRVGIVTKVTRTGTVTAAYVTPGGIAAAARFGHDPQVTHKAVKLGEYEVVAPDPQGREDTQ